MAWFYVDDAFADSKPVMRLDERSRNEAIGLWVRCGAWSAKEETDGHVPLDVVRQFGGNKRLVMALANDAALWAPVDSGENWRKTREILFQNWEKWQKTKAENEAKRKQDADRAKEYRRNKKGRGYVAPNDASSNNNETSQRDATPNTQPAQQNRVTLDEHAPDPDPTQTDTYVGNESSLNVGVERGLSDAVSPSASRLVALLISDKFPNAVRTQLRIQASQLMSRDGLDADTIADALRRWLAKPDAGPGLLPSLAADAIRARAAPTSNSHDEKVNSYLAFANPSPAPELEQ